MGDFARIPSMEVTLEPNWEAALATEFNEPYWSSLMTFVRHEYETKTVYPDPGEVFAAFKYCPFKHVKVIIIGQDPYHGPGQAHGLSFSVRDGTMPPPSLKNIYKEITTDLGRPSVTNGNLEAWAKQGVLLLNTTLTVVAGKPGSHHGHGWEQFTDTAITALSTQREHLVFMLWGNYAKAKGAHIDRAKHLVLEASHPSPLGAYKGFFGCKHFSKTNEYLRAHGQLPIVW
jgi:uracil-DNA glycosylase